MASYVEIIRLFLSSQTLDFRKNTPAYAGNTSDPSSTIPVFRDHPRLRGEYSSVICRNASDPGSPPLARGILCRCLVDGCAGGITPACAGNTSLSAPAASCTWDHPRLRGEYWFTTPMVTRSRGSPPLARGILGCHFLRCHL